jgi:hypothetical protein
MKRIITAFALAVLAIVMLLPVARQVNAASVNQVSLRQGPPMPPIPPGGGHFSLRQGPPMPPIPPGGGH